MNLEQVENLNENLFRNFASDIGEENSSEHELDWEEK